jgi:outer membrane lipoprotein-sorting protein
VPHRLLGVTAVVLAGLMLDCGRAVARCASTDACLQEIQHAQQEMRTLSADFVQVKCVSLLNEPLVSSGHLIFKRPDRILLKIEQPQPLTVVIKGRDVRIPNLPERERQSLTMAPTVAMFTQLAAIFTGSKQALEEGFEVTAVEDDTAIQVKLVPRNESWRRMYRDIQLRFAGPERFAQQLRLDDGLGDSLEITLRNVQRNIDIPDSIFDGDAPPEQGSEPK